MGDKHSATLRAERTDDYSSSYSNNVTVEPSVWDIKLTFAELDQGIGAISQHTAITLPWVVAKLLAFLLQSQITAYELQNHKIHIPPEVMPAEIIPPGDDIKDNPEIKRVYEALLKMREAFIEDAKAD